MTKNRSAQLYSTFERRDSAPSSTPNSNVQDFEKHKMFQGYISSALLGARTMQLIEIKELFETRNYDGWDGYDASPITSQSKLTAEIIINMLPLEKTSPEIVPTCVGGYSLEWKTEKKYLVIEIENKEVSCVLIDALRKKKKTSFTEKYEGGYEDFSKWIREEFPLNEQ